MSDQCVAMVNDGIIVKAEDPFLLVSQTPFDSVLFNCCYSLTAVIGD